mgnify:FL=1|tara:strand:- start:368 stop:1372 length:1005 start_codon:yes stop_codon:yes gene_type:complete
MKKIFIRSPYFLEISEVDQVGSKVELYFYNSGSSVPTEPTHVLNKSVVSESQFETFYNISNYAKGYIKPIAPLDIEGIGIENVKNWCYVLVKTFKETSVGVFVLIEEFTLVCLNGYSSFLDGYNYSSDAQVLPLLDTSINLTVVEYGTTYANVFFEVGVYDFETSEATETITVTEPNLYKIPLNSLDNYVDTYFYINNVREVCENIYTPITCKYINRLGGWQFLTFFKASSEALSFKGSDFNMLPSSVIYNPLQGQKRVFNKQGTLTVKCNTGWVDENYKELIQDLFLSDVLLLDNKPVILKSTSFESKTKLKNNNINYELEFEYNYGLMNDVI